MDEPMSIGASRVKRGATAQREAVWQASDRDWMLLMRTPAIRVWKLSALALGIHPAEGVGKLLPVAKRQEYESLRSIVRGAISFTPVKDRKSTWLKCEQAVALFRKEEHNRATLVNFLDFLSRQQIAPHPRMLEIANQSALAAPATTPAAADLDKAPRAESSTTKATTMARILLSVLIVKYGLKVNFKNEFSDDFDIDRVHGTYAELVRLVDKLGLPGVDADTPKNSIKYAIELLGPQVVREAIAMYRHKPVS